jgi:hypothetical protein
VRVSKFGRACLSTCAAVIITACASSQASTYSPRTGSTGHLESGDVRNSRFSNLYDAIFRLRPEWLRARGGSKSVHNPSRQVPVVGIFIEGEGRGYSIEKLFDLSPEVVRSVRFIHPSESMASYGTEWAWGGIVVTIDRSVVSASRP